MCKMLLIAAPRDLANCPADGCRVPGCKGTGHVKGLKLQNHVSAHSCPYSRINLARDTQLLDRLGPVAIHDVSATITPATTTSVSSGDRKLKDEAADDFFMGTAGEKPDR